MLRRRCVGLECELSTLSSLPRFGNDLFRGPSFTGRCDESSAYRFCWLEIHGCKVGWPGHQPGSQLLGLSIFPLTGHTQGVFWETIGRFEKKNHPKTNVCFFGEICLNVGIWGLDGLVIHVYHCIPVQNCYSNVFALLPEQHFFSVETMMLF